MKPFTSMTRIIWRVQVEKDLGFFCVGMIFLEMMQEMWLMKVDDGMVTTDFEASLLLERWGLMLRELRQYEVEWQ